MAREDIGIAVALALGATLIGVGFTMRGDFNYVMGTFFVVWGLLMIVVAGGRMYWRHRLRSRLPGLPLEHDRTTEIRGAAGHGTGPAVVSTAFFLPPHVEQGLHVTSQNIEETAAGMVLVTTIASDDQLNGAGLMVTCSERVDFKETRAEVLFEGTGYTSHGAVALAPGDHPFRIRVFIGMADRPVTALMLRLPIPKPAYIVRVGWATN